MIDARFSKEEPYVLLTKPELLLKRITFLVDWLADRQTDTPTGRLTDRQTDRQEGRQTERQIDRQTATLTGILPDG